MRVKVRRRRRRRSRLFRSLIRPPLELAASLGQVCRRWLAVPAAGALLTAWWFWPWISTMPGLPNSAPRSAEEVITTFVEDPQRAIGAIALWRERPGSLLVLQGRSSSQAENREYLITQKRWPSDERGMVALTTGCDTVGQLAALERWLRQRRNPGRLTIVTSPAHLGRSMAIAHILIGTRGWIITGMPVITGDNRPEDDLRTLRDQGRAQLIRAFGWDPAADAVCAVRDRFNT
ncbi:YdcF family protein [Cyanobium sp. FGCU-52]|nr:YdcF family protein [Cyanobium sp. FGCU52]